MAGVYVMEKKLSKTDTTYRFALPTEHLHHFLIMDPTLQGVQAPPSQQHISLFAADSSGKEFPLHLRVRRSSHGYLKPEIIGGWLAFVRYKSLLPGDRVIFHSSPIGNTNRMLFTISVRRALRVFGAVIGYRSQID